MSIELCLIAYLVEDKYRNLVKYLNTNKSLDKYIGKGKFYSEYKGILLTDLKIISYMNNYIGWAASYRNIKNSHNHMSTL